jgi:hypothetical protein
MSWACFVYESRQGFRHFKFLQNWMQQIFPENFEWRLISFCLGLFFLVNAVIEKSLFEIAYFYPVPLELKALLFFFEVLIGSFLFLQFSLSIPGALICLASVCSFFYFPPELVFKFVFMWLGLGLTLILNGPRISRIDTKLTQLATMSYTNYRNDYLIILRVSVCLQIILVSLLRGGLPQITELTLGALLGLGVATPFVAFFTILSSIYKITIFFNLHSVLQELPLLLSLMTLVLRSNSNTNLIRFILGKKRTSIRFSLNNSTDFAIKINLFGEEVMYPIENISHDGFSFYARIGLKDVMRLMNEDLEVSLYFLGREQKVKLQVVAWQNNRVHCEFKGKYTDYLPALRNTLETLYQLNQPRYQISS